MKSSATKNTKMLLGLLMIFIGISLSILCIFLPEGHRSVVAKIGFLFWAPGIAILDKGPQDKGPQKAP
jgi:hypothetical protein